MDALPSNAPAPEEAVLAHLDWVRALARHLCADPATADDVTQEATLVALQKDVPPGLPVRAFLAGVVRNLARRARRGEERRARRERAAARGERVPSTAELLEKVSLERKVVDLVLGLEEPYRTTVLLRYFAELEPRAIARRTGTPEGTVKTRLRRALQRLRGALDESAAGDRRAWMTVFLGPQAVGTFTAAESALPSAPLLTGTMLMNAKLVAASVALPLVCAGAYLGWKQIDAPRGATPSGAVARTVAEAREPAGAPALARAAGEPDRTPRTLSATEGAAAADAPAPDPHAGLDLAPFGPYSITGFVVDVDDVPIGGVEVKQTGDPARVIATTEPDGTFRCERVRGGGVLVVEDAGWTTVMEALLSREGGLPHGIVVARGRTLTGEVVTAAGVPVDGADVRYESRLNLRRRVARPLDRSRERDWRVRSDGNGVFAFGTVPALADGSVEAHRIGFRHGSEVVPASGDAHVRLVLEEHEGTRDALLGVVLDAARRPVEGALVSLGQVAARTDAEGAFQLELVVDSDRSSRTLTAVHSGALPARLERAEDEEWPDFVELVLGGEPLTIAGRVVDGEGRPVVGARVLLTDPTRFGYVPISAGRDDSFMVGYVETLTGSPATRGLDDHPLSSHVATDAEGRFQIFGLMDRAYDLIAVDVATLAAARREDVPAGAGDVELVVAREEAHGPLSARLVSLAGEPLVGVWIQPSRFRDGTPMDQFLTNVVGEPRRTDEDGRFSYDDIVYDGLHLGLFGGPLPTYEDHAFDPSADPAHYEIVLPTRCSFVVELRDEPERADTFRLLDAHDRTLLLTGGRGDFTFATEQGRFSDGRSETLLGPEGASTLVLEKDGAEVDRMLIKLVPGELNRIDL